MKTPVVMLLFNRPGLTRRNLEAIRRAAPEQLFVVADGPRDTHPADADLCAQVRAVFSEVDWPCEVKTRFAEKNLGLDPNIETGLDWVFSQVDRAIVLEDDCIADPTFFTSCEELLERYADEKSVWQIAGDNHEVPENLFGELSYDFSGWASIWGWATWADRWQAHRALFDRDHTTPARPDGLTPPHRTVPAHPKCVTDAGRKHFTMVAADTDPTSYFWDHHWWVTVLDQGGLSAVPRHNLVMNDGYAEGATNTMAKKAPAPSHSLDMPIRHPEHVRLNPNVEAELELVIVRTDGRLSRIVRRLIRPLWLRAVVRSIITNRLVWPFVRRLQRR